ncbi:DUF1570 domain-containing protein [Aeoliella mucimassa]|uniref:DUF1570 domain-containing protein n=1 Tax=Aeoliella mucimassa TaxID=2527972 RepID=A0A518AHV2_9BACT|nr:DUF1570 domain-containing protein [Aeoliella mucimassa]QDU54307.1 hypothetical protein Pan181_04880 [Aeoliella mucimassa]
MKQLLLCLLLVVASPVAAKDFMFEATFAGNVIEGSPLFWNESQMLLLARDGVLHTVDPRKATDAHRSEVPFTSLGTSEMRAALQREFGPSMTVTSTGHYLVVHYPGESDAWGQRFEELYRSFQNYFRVRGFQLNRPKFPLVAVIYASQQDYYEASRVAGQDLGPGALGHYDPRTNRVLMFDRVAQSDNDWAITANTIVHEATHQTAFNVGLHSRTSVTPKWVIEGLATMFEARGVHHSRAADTRMDRVNYSRLGDYRSYVRPVQKRDIAQLVASDTPFQANTLKAYADAWALTFYLSETRPREYERYLQMLADRPALTLYPAAERVRDFREAFGDDLSIFESNLASWMDELR